MKTLYLRPRRASENKRRTQIQLPIALFNQPFFAGVNSVTRKWTSESHVIVLARSKGVLNTIKLEVPEIGRMSDPVIRFTRENDGVVTYEAFDAAYTYRGGDIKALLVEGLQSGRTQCTLPAPQQDRATWYQFAW